MSTIFTQIIQGEIPCYKIYEDDLIFAFLSIKPNRDGHTLIVPKIEVDYFVDVPEPYYTAVFQVAKKLAPALKNATGCVRILTAVAGFEIPHFHYHLIPGDHGRDIDHVNSHDVSHQELEKMQSKILDEMKKLGI